MEWIKKIFERSIWIEQSRIFTPPNPRYHIKKTYGEDGNRIFEEVSFGFTTIILKDQFGSIKSYTLIGDQRCI